jgi:hypothetical protein
MEHQQGLGLEQVVAVEPQHQQLKQLEQQPEKPEHNT